MADAVVTPGAAAPKASHAKPATREVSLWTRFAYGFGSVAFGVKDNGFAYFLLIFYSQVVGVDSRAVSAAISIALVFDAFTDPLVGYFSDNLHTRWGRRHPLMYAAAVPVAILANALRVAAAGWLPFLVAGTPHAISGWLLFVLCLGTLVVVRRLFNKVYAHYQS